MMAYQENLEFYFNLSRRELQGLCKKHNLPANRSHAQLAKSLASFLRKENATSSKERSSVPKSNAKETVDPLEETVKNFVGAFEKTNSSRTDSCGLAPGINRKLSDDQLHSHLGKQLKSSSLLISQSSEKAYNTAANVVYPYPITDGTKEGFGSSNSEPGDMGTGSQVAAGIRDITTLSQLHCDNNHVASKNGSQKSSELRGCGQKLPTHAVTNTRTSNTTLVPSGHKRAGAYSRESRFMSSDETSPKAPPSLQFFVMSEEGINLYIDLNSSPSEWINSLKDKMCIHPKAQDHESETLPAHIRGLADADEHTKISPPGSTGICLQSSGMEKNTGCTDSSLGSVVSANCQTEACPPDAIVVTSRDSVLTSSSIPVEISGFLERNQVVSSSCVTNSDVYDHMASDIASCPRDEQVLHQDSDDASFRIDKSSSSVPDISLKSVDNVDTSLDGNRKPETDECCTLKIVSADFNNGEPNALDNTLNSICRTSSLPIISDGIQDNVGASYTGYSENHSGACEVPLEREHMEVLPEARCHLKMLSNSSKIDGQMVLDHPMTDAQSDVGSTDHLSNQHAWSNLATSVPNDLMSAFGDESGRCTPTKGKNSSECSQFRNTLDKNSKISHNPLSAEEFQSKRQHVCGEKSGMMSLGSSKSSVKETPWDPIVVPRRSMRLVSKLSPILAS
ncbi:uncharacterized protein LOC103706020 isoform X1 [Phoenix dactylifera]|uniref:Uncharacterized protein LOC103706020 isoform X1 n=1 Tax=Phoenix dactylifera TaxID=42345 RepID=A0A8B8ZF11_PHODC|nr:uncharacterized protein LOC103706020 isoform X1 [Phoenix dactylifera]XP_038970453.1 uncharacterized protein LOC103706020 isoform X1 [Phoenix dactylifera]